MTETADVVVFGAGPAGLAATLQLIYEGRQVVLLELGKAVTKRTRYDPPDVVTGVGGAGLYSDGKFSFYPSASGLWRLQNEKDLHTAYAWLASVLSDFTEVPAFPVLGHENWGDHYSESYGKAYDSKYVQFETRISLVRRVTRAIRNSPNGSLLTEARVERMEPDENGLRITYTRKDRTREIHAHAAIVACGRFGGLGLREVAPWVPTVFRRYEIGVRLETADDSFYFQKHPRLDPKYIMLGPDGIEWRTFCTCRNGEIVETDFLGITTYSGRSDVVHTDSSNMGFNVRITRDPGMGTELGKEITSLLAGSVEPFKVGFEKFANPEFRAFGPALDGLIRKGIRSLLPPSALDSATITGPCIEGVGFYPAADSNLRVGQWPLWVAGDETGFFRGLTAAFVSGHYAAHQAGKHLKSQLVGI